MSSQIDNDDRERPEPYDGRDYWEPVAPDVRETELPPQPEAICPTCGEVWTLEDAVSGGRFGLLAWHRYQCWDCEEGIPLAVRDERKEASSC